MTTAEYRTKWEDLCSYTDYASAKALLQTYNEGKWEELKIALEENLKACVMESELNYEMTLLNVMTDVMIMILEPQHRVQERWEKICTYRRELNDFFEDYEFLTKDYEKKIWNETFFEAKKLASAYSSKTDLISYLTENQVYETIYHPEHYVE